MNSVAQLLKRALAARLPEERVAPIVESDALDDESPDDESPDDDEPTALVCATLRPRPYSGSGAIALPEPDDHYPMA